MVLRFRVRRFTCRNAECPRRTFVEQVPGLTRRHGQRTERQRSTLAAIGLALAGRAGARLADIVGVPVSRSTVLRLVDALPEPEAPSPRSVAGWVLRRPKTLSDTEQLLLKNVRANCPEIDALTRHVWTFVTMLTERQRERLLDWLDAVRQDDCDFSS
ncbi:hypothetical protein [Streptomyces broussonetiae]|uniref:hypothetical protein n=1 Tax=Streptomyces broussonetiae TaxID=2686304 RepID=UPI0018EED773|nr:hypothetical protein [Streptomyces broussonetiae]